MAVVTEATKTMPLGSYHRRRKNKDCHALVTYSLRNVNIIVNIIVSSDGWPCSQRSTSSISRVLRSIRSQAYCSIYPV